ncbi:MAG: recombination protein RecR [Prevotellaceae bacterium]|nr:recombination protein RecR [Prevotellaceae bacterium]
MIVNDYPSRLLEQAVEAFNTLPGIGRRTALRLALHMLRQPEGAVRNFADSISKFREEVKYCRICHNISDTEICEICSDQRRDRSTLCVVQSVQDVMAIENTQQYRGLYHVLGGIISPMDGIGPGDLTIEQLVERVATGEVKEVIMALSSTTDGETTRFFIGRKLENFDVKLTTIASGISVGEELEYTDEITLARSILNRINLN